MGQLIYHEVKPSPEGHGHPSDKRQTIPMGSPVPGNNKEPGRCFGSSDLESKGQQGGSSR